MSNSPKSTNSNTSLGERLATIANKHKKVSMKNSLRAMLNKARNSGSIKSNTVVEHQEVPRFLMGEGICNKTSAPSRVIKNNRGVFVKNPEYTKWTQKCQAGGKRKTKKSKKSRRVTRRRR